MMVRYVEREPTKQVTEQANRPTELIAGQLTDQELDKVAAGAIVIHYQPQKPDGAND
jgi:hypothetical protein